MGQKKGILRHRKIHFPTSKGVSEVSERTSERSGGRERSEQSGASERVSDVSERANGRASDPVLPSRFLVALDHSASTLWFQLTQFLARQPFFSDLLPLPPFEPPFFPIFLLFSGMSEQANE